jgi:hypothetical protein
VLAWCAGGWQLAARFGAAMALTASFTYLLCLLFLLTEPEGCCVLAGLHVPVRAHAGLTCAVRCAAGCSGR